MYQMDYVMNAQMPAASLIVAPESRGPKDCVAQALADLKKDPRAVGTMKVVEEGPVRLAGHEAYQVLMRHEVPVGTATRTALIGRRTLCAGGRSYTLGLLCDVDKPEVVKALLDAIAAGLVIDVPPATTTGPTPATQPARAPGR